MSKKAELHYDGKVYDLPIITGTENENAIDISELRGQSGLITLDRGFKNTGSCESAITFLNGEEGILRYAGYDIIENPSFPDDAILFCSMTGDFKTDAIQMGTSMSSDFNNLEVQRTSNFGRKWGMLLTLALDIFVVRPEEVCLYIVDTLV